MNNTGLHMPKVLGNLLEVAGFVEASGEANSEPETEQAKPKTAASHEQPSLGMAKSVMPHAPTVAPFTNRTEVEELGKKYLDKVLVGTTLKFQQFLETKATLREALADALSGDQLEAKATDAALKSAKLSAKDVSDAIAYAQGALRGIQSDFAAQLTAARQEKVEKPAAEIEEKQKAISSLLAERAKLDEQIATLQTGIEPARQAIAKAEANLTEGQKVFEASCDFVQNALANLSDQLQNRLKGGTRGK